ncbi:hypothetical protein V8D89_001632 [Ganoderma adspersum]
MQFSLTTVAVTSTTFVSTFMSQSHTVHFDNRYGFGIPTLIQGGIVLSTWGNFTSNGLLIAAIAYFQRGNCGFSGEGCTLIETTLVDPTSVGSDSSGDISRVSPHSFSVTSGFAYFSGCDGAGAGCTNANCNTAFPAPTVTCTGGQVASQSNNVNLCHHVLRLNSESTPTL